VADARSFLFMQGPISSFFDRLGRALINRGHRVHRINLHFGDQLFWRLPATHYRGRFEDFRAFVAAELERHQVTDLVLHGDRRPYHIVAAEEARARGIAVYATDLGYVRPEWITLEHDGMTSYSRFPRDPDAIRELGACFPEPDLKPRFYAPFWLIAVLDVVYNLGLVFGRPFYPYYRYHSTVHPFAEYAGWLWSRTKERFAAPATAAAKRRLIAAPGSYFLVPLQLSTDYQIRAHSRFRDLREAVGEIVASFAASGSRRELVFVVHPLDNGLIGWTRLVDRLARRCGVARQVFAVPGGTPPQLLQNCAGIVTVNSTIGITALRDNIPVKCLGNAIYNLDGLTCQAPLAEFWQAPMPPDPALLDAFMRALVGTTQVKGGYYDRGSQDCAIAGFIERFEEGLYPLPPLGPAALSARVPCETRRSVVVTGVAPGLGVALARAYAEWGVRLALVADDHHILAPVADDCRQRGALVESALHPADLSTREAPPDTLAVLAAAGPVQGFDGPLQPVAAILVAMRRRRRGEIVLVSSLAGRALAADALEARRSARALCDGAPVLRRELRKDGLSLVVVVPANIAIRAAAWLQSPQITMIAPDRLAARIARARRRRRQTIAVPDVGTVALRALRALPSRLREAARNAAAPQVVAIGEPVDEAPLQGGSGLGD
jgi:capsular polysaccharide export protein